MQNTTLKRRRSQEFPYALQTKLYINEKFVNARNDNAMQEIYKKTTKLLFEAARQSADTNNNNLKANLVKKTPLWQLVALSGNGEVELTKNNDNYDDEFLWIKHPADCCDRNTYVQSSCSNCQKSLCEGCGYSCAECGIFLCNICVDIFGCGNSERPICGNCSLFDYHNSI